jgi:superfamily II DNA or RNA helicase
MSISLFEHNEQAYRSVERMLKETGKAAVIHPTGTGKSFIAFKFCESHPDARICWLAPSEYIFNTQKENLLSAGADVPENVTFYTYTKMMVLEEEELLKIRPNYIILDEFHRCGAERWGAGIDRLLEMYPNVPILGLSATNIRYLDNQRDMAKELFEGNIASEMTLGDAIARDILAAPKYIVSIYSYQKDLDELQKRVDRTRSQITRDAAQRQLDALRRAVSKADGVDVVFDRHMTERTGKYLVFCSNVEHMNDLLEKVPEWFGKIDTKPHVYSAYSNDPSTSRAFAKFKADHSAHLKLLFCIDMLNEGVHVDDIAGVILVRPTVSPIVYKQQIGRALSAGKRQEPVIFDIVNNFENLYSISTIEEEFLSAVMYSRGSGKEDDIKQEGFRIIDEVRDCRQLFDILNDTLTASWDLMYAEAERYYQSHNNLHVPNRYKTSEGHRLGAWLLTQRRVRAGQQGGRLSPERIAKLDAIGMIWENRNDVIWNRHMDAARKYRNTYGDLLVPIYYVTEDGLQLGRWISSVRHQRTVMYRGSGLTDERIAQLNELGMVWSKFGYQWEKNYCACAEYYQTYGHLNIPLNYVSPQGLRMGTWLRRVRRIRKDGGLSAEQIQQLDEIGMVWLDAFEQGWEAGYQHAVQHQKEHGTLNLRTTYVCEDGFPLGRWLSKNRRGDIKLTPERRQRLESLGMRWDEKDAYLKK